MSQKQLVVWRGTVVGEERREDFVNWMKENGFDVEYLTEFKTLPDEGVPNTGGRNDLLFAFVGDNMSKFAIWRLPYGMSWWEDYLDNGGNLITPQSILNQYPYGWGDNPQKYCG